MCPPCFLDGTTALLASLGVFTLTGLGLVLSQVTILLVYLLLRPDTEKPVPYSIPAPPEVREGWKGEPLKEPNLKVEGSEDIQCYAPATGEVLGRIRPHGRKDVDEAIRRAQKAQEGWKSTSYSQRRKVLRTMLKYVYPYHLMLRRLSVEVNSVNFLPPSKVVNA